MSCINFNGNILPSDTPIIKTSDRGLRYGDGIFETMKWYNNSVVHAEDHMERLYKGLRILNFVLPAYFTSEFLVGEISRLVKNNDIHYARIRVTVIRGSGNMSDLNNHQPNFIIEASDLSLPENSIAKPGVRLTIFKEARKMADILSPLKHNNFMPYCMAAMFAKKNGFDDALLLNQHGRVCETSIANIFLLDKKSIFTPALTEGCIEGVIRKNLIKILPELGYEIIETEVKEQML
ncbi:MAG: hypothetical protein EOO03_18125, partial [Chitinophagaceae bacterium]